MKSSFSSAESIPSPRRQINRASCSSSVSSFSACLCVGLRLCLLGGVNIRHAVSGLPGSPGSVALTLSECDIFLTAARAARKRPVLPCSALLILYAAAHTTATAHRDLIKRVHKHTLTRRRTSAGGRVSQKSPGGRLS